jgi:hypothetical protein
MPIFSSKTVPIYGFVGFLRLTVRTGTENYDNDLLAYARERYRELEAEIDNEVRQTLGPEFEVQNVELHKGSITVLVVLGVAGTIYMGFSRYESFIKSVNLLVSQLKGLLQRFFAQPPGVAANSPVSVTGSWQPGPVVTAASHVLSSSTGIDSCQIVLGYLLLSHAALVAVLLWLVTRHLR